MKKLFVIIDTDDFLSATNQGGEMDNGLTAAFIRGFNFCQNENPSKRSITGRELYDVLAGNTQKPNGCNFVAYDDLPERLKQDYVNNAIALNKHFN